MYLIIGLIIGWFLGIYTAARAVFWKLERCVKYDELFANQYKIMDKKKEAEK